jgi:serine/threonine-protein kinase
MVTSPLSMSPPGEPQACKQCGNALEIGVNFCSVCGLAVQAESLPDPLIGRVVADRYRIMQLIGRGGMGVVYKCEHTRMGKVMAIKLLHGDLARDQEVQRRFRREAQAASRLSHPNTVSIFDFGTSDGLMYLVMEYVSGEDLGRVLRGAGQLPPTRVAAIAAQACGSLAEAHDEGIVHRDLKPENLLISRLKDGRDLVKLLDFGLAKLREGEERNEITSAGMLIGTPYYMAPEAIRGEATDHRVDIYALGAVIYRALTGVPPFTGSSPVAVLTRALTEELVPPSRRRPESNVPAALDAVVMRCMARDPAQRFQRIDEVREALTEYLASEGLSDSLLRESGLIRRHGAVDAASRTTPAGCALAVATRDDVEAFERRLRRGRVAVQALGATIALVAAAGGVLVWRAHTDAARRPREAEVEPNQTPETATLIAPGTEVRGRLGQRLAPDRGDVDYFRLAPLPPGQWRIRVELAPQPNIDTVVELLRTGEPTAVAVADDAREGGREVIAGFRVGDADYYLSVHERVRPGGRPMENVSDTYTLRYSLAPVAPGEEIEPDDREEIAAAIAPGAERRGYVESRDDVDYWCLDAQPGPVRVTLVPPRGLDLELVVYPRDGTAERTVDQGHAGDPETADVAPPAGGRPACLVVRASGLRPPERGNGDDPYTLRLEAR